MQLTTSHGTTVKMHVENLIKTVSKIIVKK
uniref:Uncharacterized protein n=1 Tax=Anguilla anguilla TaxID=7936 RepID=A0A0E9RPD1_ANGAN